MSSQQLAASVDEDQDDARDELIPIPAVHDSPWMPLAQAISEHYRAERPVPTFEQPTGRVAHLANPDIVCVILHASTNGLTPTQAGLYAGISEKTITRWMERGEKQPESAFGRFCLAMKMAREDRRNRLLAGIEKASTAGPQHWTAGAWLLERGYGNDYKLNQDKTGGQVIVNVGIVGAKDVQIGGESPPDSPLEGVIIGTPNDKS